MARELKVKIRGTCDYLQHKRPLDEEKVSKKSGEIDHSQDWKSAVYQDKQIGCYIPSKQLRASLVKSATDFPIPGKGGKKTYKDLVNATIEVIPDKIGMGKKKPDYIHEEWVKVQRSQILRNRPAFKDGWEAQFTLLVLDEQMPVDIVKDILENAGRFRGIGDWRPHFGRFEVVEFKENSK